VVVDERAGRDALRAPRRGQQRHRTTIPGQLTFTETGLSENTSYTRSVYAINAAGASPASNAFTRFTKIRDPIPTQDFMVSLNANTGIYTATVTPPPNSTVGQTGVQIEAKSNTGWEVVKPLNSTYTYTSTGVRAYNLWRIWFRNGGRLVQLLHLPPLQYRSYRRSDRTGPAINPPPATVGGSSDSANSIVWTWSDTDISDLGFILLVPNNATLSDGGGMSLFARQINLAENTQYSFAVASANIGTCPYSPTITRYTRVHDPGVGDFSLSAAANQVTVTVTPPPNGTSGYTGCYIERSTDLVNWGYVSYWSPTYSITNTGWWEARPTTTASRSETPTRATTRPFPPGGASLCRRRRPRRPRP
jgi:hypothetical protein